MHNLTLIIFDFKDSYHRFYNGSTAEAHWLWHKVVINIPQPLVERDLYTMENLSFDDIAGFLSGPRRVLRLKATKALRSGLILKQ